MAINSPVRVLASNERPGKSDPMALMLQLKITNIIRTPKNVRIFSISVCQPTLKRGVITKNISANPITVAKTALPKARLGIENPTRIAKNLE